jgi:hypothetical protein
MSLHAVPGDDSLNYHPQGQQFALDNLSRGGERDAFNTTLYDLESLCLIRLKVTLFCFRKLCTLM